MSPSTSSPRRRLRAAALVVLALTMGLAPLVTPDAHAAVTAVPTSRDRVEWPFASTSPWNVPVGSGARFAGETDTITRDVRVGGAGINAGNWSHPVYEASASDPVWQVYDRSPGDPTTMAWSSQRLLGTIRAPLGLVPAGNPGVGEAWFDRHLHVVQPDGDTVQELYATYVDQGARRISVTHSAQFSLSGSGMGTPSTRASGLAALGGLIRASDLRAGQIPHALAVALNNDQMRRGPVWPAALEDGHSATEYHGTVPMGTLIAIPPSVDLNALGLSPGGLVLARALQDYGAYLTDGSSRFVFYAEPAAEGMTLLAQMRLDASRLQELLRPITNNTASSVGGGGTPRAAVAPPLSGTGSTTTTTTSAPPTTTTTRPATTTTTSTTTTTRPTTTTTVQPVTGTNPIRVSEYADRSASRALDGTTVDDRVHVFVDPAGVRSVSFTIDGRAARSESSGPFDFESSGTSATPLRTLTPGAHAIGATITSTTGTQRTVTARFTVAGSTSTTAAPTTTTAAPTTTTAAPTTTTTAAPTTTTAAPVVVRLLVSDAADHTGGRPLDGATLAPESYVFVDPAGIRSVAFALDGQPTRSESAAPFDFESSGDTATVLRPLAPGGHTITATVTATDGRQTTATARFTAPMAAAPADTIRISGSADRSASRQLGGTTIGATSYVFVDDAAVRSVSFALDGQPTRSESAGPFDFEASGTLATALRPLATGRHVIVATLTYTDGSQAVATAQFTR